MTNFIKIHQENLFFEAFFFASTKNVVSYEKKYGVRAKELQVKS